MSHDTTPQPEPTPETNPHFTPEQHRITESMLGEFEDRIRNENLHDNPDRLLETATEMSDFIASGHYVPGALGIGFRLVQTADITVPTTGVQAFDALQYELVLTGRAVDLPVLLSHFDANSPVREAVWQTANEKMDEHVRQLADTLRAAQGE